MDTHTDMTFSLIKIVTWMNCVKYDNYNLNDRK